MSRPVWGAWIEMSPSATRPIFPLSRPVWGAWIEIVYHQEAGGHYYSRAPYGARGLKWLRAWSESSGCAVAPRMGRVD